MGTDYDNVTIETKYLGATTYVREVNLTIMNFVLNVRGYLNDHDISLPHRLTTIRLLSLQARQECSHLNDIEVLSSAEARVTNSSNSPILSEIQVAKATNRQKNGSAEESNIEVIMSQRIKAF